MRSRDITEETAGKYGERLNFGRGFFYVPRDVKYGTYNRMGGEIPRKRLRLNQLETSVKFVTALFPRSKNACCPGSFFLKSTVS